LKRIFIFTLIVFVSCSIGTKKNPEAKQTMSLKTFKDSMNTAVFTTKFVILDNKDITLVRHDADDGAWTFFSNDKYEDYKDVAKIVGLGQIIKIDSSVLEIADLPLGYYASRNSKQDNWKVEQLKEK
jgi:hypothetical protein